MSKIFTERLTGSLASLDVTWRYGHLTQVIKQDTSASSHGVGSSVWCPQSILPQDEPEKVQKRATSFCNRPLHL